jgi:hypothetical protein
MSPRRRPTVPPRVVRCNAPELLRVAGVQKDGSPYGQRQVGGDGHWGGCKEGLPRVRQLHARPWSSLVPPGRQFKPWTYQKWLKLAGFRLLTTRVFPCVHVCVCVCVCVRARAPASVCGDLRVCMCECLFDYWVTVRNFGTCNALATHVMGSRSQNVAVRLHAGMHALNAGCSLHLLFKQIPPLSVTATSQRLLKDVSFQISAFVILSA